MISLEMAEFKNGRMIFARLSEDENLLEAILHVAKNRQISSGIFLLIGSLKKAKVGFFRGGRYETISIDEPLEIVSCMGNISLKESEPFVHAHIAVSNEKGEVFGGHVMPGCVVAATGELVLLEALNGKLRRKLDTKTGLYVWSLSE